MENQSSVKFEKANSSLPCWLIAFFINLVIAMLAICPFLIQDHGYFAMSHDYSAEEIPFNMLMNETVKSGNLLWNWGIDIGSNFLESFSFYDVGSVFFWILLLFPPKMMPKVMGWMLILKFAVAGATSSAYLQRYSKNRVLVIMASMLYAFSGFQCSSVVFYHFQDAVALFPLMMIGLEMLVEENKHGRLVIACVLNVLCNYTFFVGEVIFLVLFYVFKYMMPNLALRKRGLKIYVKPVVTCMIEGAIGSAIGGILLIPSIYGTISNSRINSHIAGCDWMTMTTRDWLLLLKGFLFPAESMNAYSNVVRANWMTNAAYLPLFGILLVLAYMISKKDWLSQLLRCCFIIAAVPILNSVFMMFMPGGYRRWFYMFVLVMALATIQVAEKPKEYNIKKATLIWIACLGLYIVLTKFVDWSYEESSIIYDLKRYFLGLLVAILGVILTWLVLVFVRKQKELVLCILVGLFSAGTLFLSVHQYRVTTDNTSQDFKCYENSYSQNVANYLTEIPDSLEKDVLPYRYYFDEGIGYTYYNLAMTNSLPSINSFISTAHSSIGEFYDNIGIGRGTWTNAGTKGVRELLSARYIVSLIDQTDYKFVKDIKNSNGQIMHVYENNMALPIGFTYDTYMTQSEFMQLDKNVRAIAMLKTLVVKDDDVSKIENSLRHYNVEIDGDISDESWQPSIEERRKESSREFKSGENMFELTIRSDSEKYAFFSVPYDKCWKASVNGNDTDILNINGLMAVQIEKGDNEICFHYEYWPVRLGAVCSAFGVMSFILYMLIQKKIGDK